MAAIIACMFVLCSCSDKKDADNTHDEYISTAEKISEATPADADTTDDTKVDVAEYYSMVDERIDKIKKSENYVQPKGTVYYISSSEGDDGNDGLSPETPWKTCENVNRLLGDDMWNIGEDFEGATFLFKRGDVWHRDKIYNMMANCIYSTYGDGEKPVFDMSYNISDNAANPDYWVLAERYDDIWVYKDEVPFLGSITLDDVRSADNKDAYYWDDVWYNADGNIPDEELTLFDLDTLSDEQFFVDVHPGEKYKYDDNQYYIYDCTDVGKLYYRSKDNPGDRYDTMWLCNDFGVQCGNNCIYDNLVVKNCGNQAFSNFPSDNAIGCKMFACEVYFCGDQYINMSYADKQGFGGGETCGFHGEYSEYVDNYFYGSREGAGTCEIGWTGDIEEYDNLERGNITYAGNVIHNCDGGFGIICFLDRSTVGDRNISFENINITDNYFVNIGYDHDADGNDKYSLGSIFIMDNSHVVNMQGLKISDNLFLDCGDKNVISVTQYNKTSLPEVFSNNEVVLKSDSDVHIVMQVMEDWVTTYYKDESEDIDKFLGPDSISVIRY